MLNTARIVTMYTTTWCGDCRIAKQHLARLGIPFVEVNIETDPEAAETVQRLNDGRRSVPTLVVGGEATSLSGFTRAKFDAFVARHALTEPPAGRAEDARYDAAG